jgi:replicative DNA helicase
MSGGIRDPETTSTTSMAEEALLGALVWDPGRVRDVMNWLEPDDFYRPAQSGIYTILVKLTRAGVAADPLTVSKVLAEARDVLGHLDGHVTRAGSGLYGASYLHTLLSFTPATPNPARDRGSIKFYTGPNISHHVAYARLVLEASVRRQLQGAGIRMGQHAREAVVRAAAEQPADATVTASAQRLEPVLKLIERQLNLLATRLPAARAAHPAQRVDATSSTPHPSAAPTARDTPPDFDRSATSGRDQTAPELSPVGAPTARELSQAECWVIGGCLVSANVRDMATSVLRAGDFTDPALAATWTAIATLHERGDSVDFVLVSAQLDRQTDAPVRLPPSDLALFACRADYLTGCWGLQTVALEALHRAVDTAHRELLAAAQDNTQSIEQAIRRAQAVLTRTQDTARRLRGDTPNGPVERAAAADTAIAGPPGADPRPRRARRAAAPLHHRVAHL